MDGLIGPGVVPFGQGDVAPADGMVGEATGGSLGKPRTILQPWWITLVIRELRAVVIAGGLTPNARVYTQVRDAIRAMIAAATVPKHPRQTQFLQNGVWTAPAGVTRVRVRVVGGGGAGGGCLQGNGGHSGGGGGAGGYAEGWCTVVPGQAYPITVGAFGTPVINTAGTDGGTSSFGSFLTATGGKGGAAGTPDSHGGAPGVGSLGAGVEGFGTPGGFGSDGNGLDSTAKGGDGGASAFGGGGRSGTAGGMTGLAAGSGGGGGYNTTALAGNGAAGLVILEWWE